MWRVSKGKLGAASLDHDSQRDHTAWEQQKEEPMSMSGTDQTSLMGLKPMKKREPVLIKELIGLQRLQQLLFL